MQVLKEFKFNPSENTFIEINTEKRSIFNAIRNLFSGSKKRSYTETIVCDRGYVVFKTNFYKGAEIEFESVNKVPLDQITEVTTVFYKVGILRQIMRLFSLRLHPADFNCKGNLCFTIKAGADDYAAIPLFIFEQTEAESYENFKEAADLLAELSAKKVR